MEIKVDQKIEVSKEAYGLCMGRYSGYFFGRKDDDGNYFIKAGFPRACPVLKQIIELYPNE
jgi:hypothetical protein